MNFDLINRITVNLEQCGGKPCIRGMRIRVTDVLELLAAGITPDQIVTDELPDLALADVQACLQYAVIKLNHPVLHVATSTICEDLDRRIRVLDLPTDFANPGEMAALTSLQTHDRQDNRPDYV